METCRTVASTSHCAGGPSDRGSAGRPRAGVAGRLLPWLLLLPVALASAQGSAAVDPCRPDEPLRLAAERLQAEYAAATAGDAKARAAAALGAAHLKLNRLALAEPLLTEAEATLTTARERAAAAVDLGQLHLLQRAPDRAEAAWARAAGHAAGHADLALAVEVNRLLLPAAPQRAERLAAAASQLAAAPAGEVRARHALHLAAQARSLGDAGTALAHRLAEAARSEAAGSAALLAEADDLLSSLYEAAGRDEEALRLAERGLQQAQQTPARELAVPLEWRAARVAQRAGRGEQALVAYRRAVGHIEAVRSDIPVTYLDGRSSFRDTLEPVYLGLTDLLLQRAAADRGAGRLALLRQARDTVELIKQTELEDYLRDRCSVGNARRDSAAALPAGTAIYYPIILPDRLELLLETAQGIDQVQVPVAADELRRAALDFVAVLRSRSPYRVRAEALYRWLVAPIEPLLAERGVQTLVAVPDGVLRLVPLAALHDGRDFLLKRLTVATVPGLSMTELTRRDGGRPGNTVAALLAGMSEPGPVVDKLPAAVVDTVLDPATDPARGGADTRSDTERRQARTTALREALALPGVKQEIEEIGRVLGAGARGTSSTSLLDRGFTLAALERELTTRHYPVVHIASHGVFGDSADTTFIMTYDELLTLDALQKLLSAQRRQGRTIEMITLSACQTAEGDDRAPLGMSGTAIKARARSALGTLWPVSDDAAQRLMTQLYRRLAEGGISKVEALRAAQLELVNQRRFDHPFYWAPFILIGDWS